MSKQTRQHILTACFNDAEWDDIQEQAIDHKLTVSEYIKAQCCEPLMSAGLVEHVKAWCLINGREPRRIISLSLFHGMYDDLPGSLSPTPIIRVPYEHTECLPPAPTPTDPPATPANVNQEHQDEIRDFYEGSDKT